MNQLFGDIVKVTPSSKVVGDMALFMVTNDLTADDVLTATAQLSFPRSVVEMMQGMLGEPEGGWPKVFQEIVLDSAQARSRSKGRPGAELPQVDFAAAAAEDPAPRSSASRARRTCCRTCCIRRCSSTSRKHRAAVRQHVDASRPPTSSTACSPARRSPIEIERGKTLIVKYLTTGEVREDGTRTVFFELNGQPREVSVADRSVERHR